MSHVMLGASLGHVLLGDVASLAIVVAFFALSLAYAIVAPRL